MFEEGRHTLALFLQRTNKHLAGEATPSLFIAVLTDLVESRQNGPLKQTTSKLYEIIVLGMSSHVGSCTSRNCDTMSPLLIVMTSMKMNCRIE
jgi:hypothetical protein